MSGEAPLLVTVVELGGYPNFTPLYQRLGYRVESVTSGRKAIALLKRLQPAALVTEFNTQHSFRDRTSNLESILAVVQPKKGMKVVVFYDQAVHEPLEQVRARFPGFTAMAYPVDEAALEGALKG